MPKQAHPHQRFFGVPDNMDLNTQAEGGKQQILFL
jgi:hypothetical protein